MKFKRFQCMFWWNRIYLLPTIVIDFDDASYGCRTFSIEFHFLLWHLRLFWMDEVEHGQK